jgi:hypothetical protein
VSLWLKDGLEILFVERRETCGLKRPDALGVTDRITTVAGQRWSAFGWGDSGLFGKSRGLLRFGDAYRELMGVFINLLRPPCTSGNGSTLRTVLCGDVALRP